MPPLKSRTKLGKRGIVSLPLDLLEAVGIEPGSRVWLISDGDLLIIRSVFQRPMAPPSTFIGQLRGAFKRFLSR